MKVPYEIVENMKKSWQCPMCQHEYCTKHFSQKKYDIPLHDTHDDEYTCEAQVNDVGVNELVEYGLIK